MATATNTKHCTYLPERQERFCLNLVQNSMPASEALIAAGYAPTTSNAQYVLAARLLRQAKVQARIRELRADSAAVARITSARVLHEYSRIAFANLGDYFTVQEDGSAFVDLSQCTRDQLAALSEITVEEYTEGQGKNARDIKRVKVKLHPKVAALDSLGKHLGMFIERHEHRGAFEIRVQYEDGRTVTLGRAEPKQLEAPEQESTGAPE